MQSSRPASPPRLDDPAAATLCSQARDLAEAGHADRAAELYERVVADAGPRYRAQAALGLAVVRDHLGDTAGARQADETAIAAADPEFSPRAAYHLALLCEKEGDSDAAARAWQTVVEFGNQRYLGAAHHGLARLAEARGDDETARSHWQYALNAADPQTVADAARDYARRLLERGAAAEAAEVLARGLAAHDTPDLRLLLGAVRVEQAIAEFDTALAQQPADPHDTAVARELLARLLAVRGDSAIAERVWYDGLTHDDPQTAAEVRARLRRGFLTPDPDVAAETGEATFWWDPYLEAAVASDTTPMLAGELFAALSRIYALLAQADGPARADAALAAALQVVDDYVWGAALRDDVHAQTGRTTTGLD